jgi:MFS family permease
MFRFWRYRDFGLLWVGQLGSLYGDVLLHVALLVYVFDVTHSTRATTAVFLAESAPPAVLGLFAGAVADRFDRRRLLLGADTARALLLLPLVAFHSGGQLWLLLAVVAVNASIGSVFLPAYSALLPATLPADDLPAANSFNIASRSTATILGPPAGAILLTGFGLTPLVLIDIATFVGSVFTVALVNIRATSQPTTTRYLHQITDGVRYLRRHQIAATITLTATVFGLGSGLIAPLAVPFFRANLHASQTITGLAFGLLGVGGVLGAVTAAPLLRRLGARRATISADIGAAATVTALAVAPTYFVALPVNLGIGATNGLFAVAEQTLLQTTVTHSYLGRAFGALSAAASLAALTSAALPLLLADIVGVRGLFVLGATLTIAAAAISFTGLNSATAKQLSDPATSPTPRRRPNP